MKSLWIVCYDITNEKRLRKIATCMKGFGEKKQKSVFECWLDDALLKEMFQEVQKHLQQPPDSFRCYQICDKCQAISRQKGKTEIQAMEKYYIV